MPAADRHALLSLPQGVMGEGEGHDQGQEAEGLHHGHRSRVLRERKGWRSQKGVRDTAARDLRSWPSSAMEAQPVPEAGGGEET
jgi:hypothetical protein